MCWLDEIENINWQINTLKTNMQDLFSLTDVKAIYQSVQFMLTLNLLSDTITHICYLSSCSAVRGESEATQPAECFLLRTPFEQHFKASCCGQRR